MPNIPSKTPFIPESAFGEKEAVYKYKEAGWGLIFKIVVFLFIVSLAGLGSSLVYKKVLIRQLDELTLFLERARTSFDPALIVEMEDLSKSIPVVEGLLGKHHYPSKIFELLESLTTHDVRFTKFAYTFVESKQAVSRFAPPTQPPVENPVSISLDGEARNFTALAQQAEVFSANGDINSFSFSNFTLTQGGNVSFSLEIVLNSTIFEI